MRVMNWAGLVLTCALAAVAQNVPQSFNYQGVLRGGSGELLPAGIRNVDFRLYAGSAVSDVLWGRTYAVMLDTNGLFNVELNDESGSVLVNTNLAGVVSSQKDLYLGITVSGSSEIMPRQRLLSVPFALMAGDVRMASAGLTVNGALNANGGVVVSGTLNAQNELKLGDVTLTSKAVDTLGVPGLNVDGNAKVAGDLNVDGNAKVARDLNVDGNTSVSNLTVSGSVSLFSGQGNRTGTQWNPATASSTTLCNGATSDGFLVISLSLKLNTNGGSDKNLIDTDFRFHSNDGSDKDVPYSFYIYDMDCYEYDRTESITLPVRKGDVVTHVVNSKDARRNNIYKYGPSPSFRDGRGEGRGRGQFPRGLMV